MVATRACVSLSRPAAATSGVMRWLARSSVPHTAMRTEGSAKK
ncbi:hypothetical protein ACFQQB_10145 [Nonomuraea rubra]